ncbi:nitroreductase family protein [Desulfuromonas thiophila]|uniref:Nitroreductase n=1 Tax=Desulfuromonas thiophila TaxID=57664 RepID=A0A1G7CTH3_9BACT|nr:nitroreductase family protein [Desulfuromonas thiophila]SDE41956.1 Nitroreductase [Desulfuromonas thiophila]
MSETAPSALLALLRQRRSVRSFTDQPLTEAQRQLLREVALRAPSSRGRSPWHFIFVEDRALLGQLAQAKQQGSAFLANAALAVVVCADPQISDVWIEDCALATTLLHLAASEAGLGSCWVQIRQRPHDANRSAESWVQSCLAIPPNLRVATIVGIGWTGTTLPGHAAESLAQERLHQQRFGQ